MNRTKRVSGLLLACLTLGWVGSAVADTVTITFEQVLAVNAPLSPWLSVAIALAVALTALAFFRGKGAQRFFMFGASLIIAAGALVVDKNVQALSPATQLITSPYVETFGNCGGSINGNTGTETFTSGTGSTIRILSVTDVGTSSILTPPTTCTAGTLLTPATTCIVATTSSSVC